jgi:sucrose phosphorylase
MKNQVQLITYADRLSGGTLRDLHGLLTGPLRGVFGAVHVLPFFHPIDGADAGFDPIDHTRVDPRLGGWDDVRALTQDIDVMADVIVNHLSVDSPQFRDWQALGALSAYDGMFLTLDAVFPRGATERDLAALYRPRPGLPLSRVTLASGEPRIVWTTFTPHQVDIDVRHPQGRAYLDGILRRFGAHGIRMVRLDAVGYAIKRAGASCFLMPETFAFIEELSAAARSHGLEVLVEIHAHYQSQIDIAARVDWVYDFALPPLVLHAILFRTSRCLAHWIRIRPTNAVTVLDTHDGIGIIDAGAEAADRAGRPGLVPPEELDRLVELIHDRSRGQSRLATGAAAANLDLYQVNCTFFDALGGDERAYLLARAIQFFLPGVPQVYYVGLLAGRNDMELLARTGVGRDINRHYYKPGEAAQALAQPVVRRLLALIAFRNTHPAFAGTFELSATDDWHLDMRWTQGRHRARLTVDFSDLSFELTGTGASGSFAAKPAP